MLPQGLIDQWLSKSRESRRSVQEDPKATPAILENIRQLEAHCVEHPYEVFCASALRSPPFALYALESDESEKARLARPPAPLVAPPSFSESVDTSTAQMHDGGLGGRCKENAERQSLEVVAADHLRSVTARLAAYLQSSKLVISARSTSDRAKAVAQLVVRVVAEAAVTAAVRQGVATTAEAEEQAAFQQRLSRRRLQLSIQGSCYVNNDSTGASHVAAADASNEKPNAADDDSSADAGDYYVAARPIADYRRDCQGLLSMVGLLRQRQRCLAKGEEDDIQHSAPFPYLALGKRMRNDVTNFWTQLREDGLQQWFGQKIPPPPPIEATAKLRMPFNEKARPPSAESRAAEGWAGIRLQITERDVLFALQKVLGSDAYECTATIPPPAYLNVECSAPRP